MISGSSIFLHPFLQFLASAIYSKCFFPFMFLDKDKSPFPTHVSHTYLDLFNSKAKIKISGLKKHKGESLNYMRNLPQFGIQL